MMTGDETRGECPECGRVMQVRADGNLRHHRDTPWTEPRPHAAEQCSGSGLSPVMREAVG